MKVVMLNGARQNSKNYPDMETHVSQAIYEFETAAVLGGLSKADPEEPPIICRICQ